MRQAVVRCVEFVESVTEWTEGALSDDDRLTIEEHLVVCPHCTDYLVQLRLATEVLHEQPPEAPATATRTALLTAFRSQRDSR